MERKLLSLFFYQPIVPTEHLSIRQNGLITLKLKFNLDYKYRLPYIWNIIW
jgi:hypothetical protein